VEVASMMKKSAAMLEIGRDVVVLAGGIALVLVTPWLNTKGDQEVTGALLIYGLVLAGTAPHPDAADAGQARVLPLLVRWLRRRRR